MSSQSSDHVLRTLEVFRRRSQQKKVASTVGLGIVGASSTAAGLLLDLRFDRDYGRPIWIAGVSSLVAAGLLYLMPTPMQLLARQANGDEAELQSTWRRVARAVRTSRRVNGFITLGLGGAALVMGGVFAAGAAKMSDETRSAVSMTLLLAGGAFAARGTTALLVESDVEQGYRVAFENAQFSSGRAPFDFFVGAVPGGAAASVAGRF